MENLKNICLLEYFNLYLFYYIKNYFEFTLKKKKEKRGQPLGQSNQIIGKQQTCLKLDLSNLICLTPINNLTYTYIYIYILFSHFRYILVIFYIIYLCNISRKDITMIFTFLLLCWYNIIFRFFFKIYGKRSFINPICHL